MQPETETENIEIIPLPGDGEVNLDTIHDTGLTFPDFPHIRDAIRKYAEILIASQLILERRNGDSKSTVVAVRDTRELLVDGRPALNVAYTAELSMPSNGGTSRYTDSTLIPIDTVSELVARIESGDIPFNTIKTQLAHDSP